MAPTSFGGARQCRYRFTGVDGRVHEGWTWDPTWQPGSIPAGALRGDIARQVMGAFSTPRYWYEDRERRCVQCGQRFVFSAAEQKYWYETLGFYEESVAIRCAPCRKQRRTAHALREGLATALRASEASPKQPEVWLDVAAATAALFETTGAGDLDRGIAAARRASRLGDVAGGAVAEAELQRLASRPRKARASLEAAMTELMPRRRRRQIERALAALDAEEERRILALGFNED